VRIPSKLTPVVGGALLSCALGAGAAPANTPPATPHDPGIWQKHEYSFAFMGFTSTYSCDGLADKLKLLLIASGARADAKARSGACPSGFGRPDKFARADLTFYTLAPAPGDKPADAAGVWRPVTLAARKPRELATGDCELVEQFKSSVLPMFTTRNVDSHTVCVPHQNSGSVIDLKFESFSATPQKRGPK
jgi:hypothetical protein